MAASRATIRIGYVPEHYLTPLHLAIRSASSLPFDFTLIPFPSGTGHMITSLREKEIDIGIGLTEGWVAGLTGKSQLHANAISGGYKVVGHWVETPLRWAIVTGRERENINSISDLKGGRVGVSRLGSGSHIMSFVLSQQQGWGPDSLSTVPLGPFSDLRDGVTGFDPKNPDKPSNPSAEFFMWEQFTTKPYFHETADKPHPPLKKIGEIYTPWPSWLIVASTSTFPDPEKDENLTKLFEVLDKGIKDFEGNTDQAVKLLGTGELGCTYTEDDAKEWLKDVRFAQGGTRGVDKKVIEGVVDVLKVAGVVSEDMKNDEAIQRVVGISR
ncbi:PQ-loop repeat-containing protein 1 [Paecilomyces lecythidis]